MIFKLLCSLDIKEGMLLLVRDNENWDNRVFD